MSETGAFQQQLLMENEEYRSLVQQHRDLESRLTAYQERVVLNEDEQVEETQLKKRKLQVKDRMALIARRAREASPRP
jgi:uncharacterized protein YdcH (DUF465 family)